MQYAIRPVKRPIHATLIIPGSAALTQRAMLIAALANGVSEISHIRLSRTTRNLADNLHELGIVTQLDEKTQSCILAGGNGKFPKKEASLWCGHSKVMATFLLAAAAASPSVYFFDGTQPLRQKYLTPQLKLLRRQSVQFIPSEAHKLPVTLIGADTLEGGEVILGEEANATIISAMLMIAPFARAPFQFSLAHIENPTYIDMTCSMMADFGVLVHHLHQHQLMVPVPQRYQAKDFTIEPDITLAAYFFAAAAVTGGQLTIQAFKRSQSKQPNLKFLSVLESMGCVFYESSSGFSMRGPKELLGVEVSMRTFSDCFLILTAMAPFAKSPVRITHIGKIQAKEYHYMAIAKSILTKLGIHVEMGDDWIKVYPGTVISGDIHAEENARVAMAFSLLGLRTPKIAITEAECVNRYYPNFFSQWNSLAEAVQMDA